MGNSAQLEEIVSQALKLSSAEARTKYIHGACGGNPEFIQQVTARLKPIGQRLPPPRLPPLPPLPSKANAGASPSAPQPARPIEVSLLTLREEIASVPSNRNLATTILGTHEVIRELARGGLGVVYLARHRVLKDLRAIKRPQSRDGVEQLLLRSRFEREVAGVGALRHDHIVRALDAGEDSEGPYLIMEYLDGLSLSEIVKSHGPLGVPEACELIRQAALGLQAAHERGLVHRDIKPSNLMLARANSGARVVIIDWGLVKRPSDAVGNNSALTNSGTTMGTLDYIAPEQIADAGDVSIRADIYSLGVTFYCLLSGAPPFHNQKNTGKIQGQLAKPFPPLRELRPDVAPAILAILNKMVDKDAEKRYASPREVAEQLQPYCCGAESPALVGLLERPLQKKKISSVQTPDVFVQETELVVNSVARGTPMNSPNNGRSAVALLKRGMGWWIAACAVILLCVGWLLGIIRLNGPGKPKQEEQDNVTPPDNPNSTQKPQASKKPGLPIIADFKKVLAEFQSLPDGWTGDAYGVVGDRDKQACLENNKPPGGGRANPATIDFVSIHPPELGRNFYVDGEFLIWGHRANYGRREDDQSLTVRLKSLSPAAPEPIDIVIDHTGEVTIAKGEPRQAAGFEEVAESLDGGPIGKCEIHHFRIIRNGRTLRIDFDGHNGGKAANSAQIDEHANFDSVEIALTPGKVNGKYKAKLYGLAIGTDSP